MKTDYFAYPVTCVDHPLQDGFTTELTIGGGSGNRIAEVRGKERAEAFARAINSHKELLALARRIHLELNGVHCTLRATSPGYRALPVFALLESINKQAADAVHHAEESKCNGLKSSTR